MWIETATEGEYLNPDMIERVTVEDTTLTAHMPSGAFVCSQRTGQLKRALMHLRP
jgi:hypothetical protein